MCASFRGIRNASRRVFGRWPLPQELKQHIKRFKSWKEMKKMGIVIQDSRWNKNSFMIGEKFLRAFPETRIRAFTVEIKEAKFESPVCIAILLKGKNSCAEIAMAKLNFAELQDFGKSILFEGIQGVKGKSAELSAFRKESGKVWANYLVEKGTAHARKLGFKAAGIIDPHWLYWYQEPAKAMEPEKRKEVKKQIRGLYSKVARALGFSEKAKTGNAIYWMKRL